MTDRRSVLAALLALLWPGLGHASLRAWGRSLLWFVLMLSTASLVIPRDAVPSTLTADAVLTATSAVPTTAVLVIDALVVLSVVDAYRLGRARHRRDQVQEGTQCPTCGRELDEDLEFCHWCTTRIEGHDHAASAE